MPRSLVPGARGFLLCAHLSMPCGLSAGVSMIGQRLLKTPSGFYAWNLSVLQLPTAKGSWDVGRWAGFKTHHLAKGVKSATLGH